ncbi:MAG: PQQ-binding-like beta-propeller repeat protein, partial [Planctomycetales bacterium]|nr:PQQ-binding-like beta-propeller repeat protein [Planctomycetales bacterium]
QTQSDAPFVAAPAVINDFIVAIVRGAQADVLRRYDAESLQMAAASDLPGRVIWGPVRANDVALVMTDQGRLLGLDAASVRFDVAASQGPVVGQPVVDGGQVTLTSQAGSLWSIKLADGQTIRQVDVGETLSSGPVPFAGDRYLVTGGDGTLHIVPLTSN